MEYTKVVYKTNKEIADELINKAESEGYLEELDFSILMHNLLISDSGYVIDVGNNSQVSAEVALRLKKRIDKHPLLWKLLFMVA